MFLTFFVPSSPMSFRLPTKEEIATLERLVADEWTTDYSPRPKPLAEASRSSTPVYGEWLFHEIERPVVRDVAPFVLGSSTMGVYFPGLHEIWMNSSSEFAASYGATLDHEVAHAHTPYRDPDPRENELANRKTTYAITGDHGQLAGFYHP